MKRPLSAIQIEYIFQRLDSSDEVQVKRGLQQVCDLYRQGRVIAVTSKLHALRSKLNACVFARDSKIRRWALNAIARAGNKQVNGQAVWYVIEKYANDPETLASAVAALTAIDPASFPALGKDRNLDQNLLVLSALQHGDISSTDLGQPRINIESASSDILKLALLLVGLEKAPEHIFDPRHENGAIVRALGRHQDAIVSQYSVWAITENKKLSIKDIGIDITNLDRYSDNVRAWTNRLIGLDADLCARKYGLFAARMQRHLR